jgi:catechol-2,3-dioxygenase
MKVRELGHAVLYVSDIERSRRFYRDLLGLPELFFAPGGPAGFSTGRTHHDLLLFEAGPDAAPIPAEPRVGLQHLAFKIGTTDEELRSALGELRHENVAIVRITDHGATHSVYFLDPDGNQLEVFIDT